MVSRCFPGGYNVKLYISKGRLAWWLLAFLCCEWLSVHDSVTQWLSAQLLCILVDDCITNSVRGYYLCEILPLNQIHHIGSTQWWLKIKMLRHSHIMHFSGGNCFTSKNEWMLWLCNSSLWLSSVHMTTQDKVVKAQSHDVFFRWQLFHYKERVDVCLIQSCIL